VTLTTHPNGTLEGAVHFLAQDGQTSVQFTFTGTAAGQAATLVRGDGGAPVSMTWS
jgi:hypothetical protein